PFGPIHGGHVGGAPQRRLAEADLVVQHDIVTLALEDGVGSHVDREVDVARRTAHAAGAAAPGHPQLGSALDPRRDLHRKLLAHAVAHEGDPLLRAVVGVPEGDLDLHVVVFALGRHVAAGASAALAPHGVAEDAGEDIVGTET